MVRFHTTGAVGEQIDITAADGTGDPIVGVQTDAATRNGSWEVDSTGLGTGDYRVRLLGPGGVVVATAPFSVAAADATPALTLDAAAYKVGDPITASWRDAPGSRWDWIGVYARGADPLVDSYLYYVYTDQEVMGSVVIDASGEGDWPLPPGEYDAHYLLDDGYASLAVAPFTVTD